MPCDTWDLQLPEDLVVQFRAVALERLDRIEAAWSVVLVALNDDAASLLHREVHTLKGESQVLGFGDVNLVCHKLEDLLEVARARGYAVDEDFDLSVNMALRFMGMLVRKKVGSHLGGIDLPGFVRQIDEVLEKSRPQSGRSRTGKMAALSRPRAMGSVPPAIREQLGPVAVDAFIEYATARGAKRNRLRASWQALRDMIGLHRAVVGTPQLIKHKAGALSLAREVGKQLEVGIELGAAEVTTEMLAAIDVAALHLIRNAVDHGIELPAAREAAGKPPQGTIRLRGGMRDDGFAMTIADDGRGIDWDQIRVRARELGMLAASADPLPEQLVELMCQPGFSTRAEPGAISGRGVGLDAVRAGLAEVGGTLTAASVPGRGATWAIRIPAVPLTVAGLAIRAAGVPFPIVLDLDWSLDDKATPARTIDLASELGIGSGEHGTAVRFTHGALTIGILCEGAPVAQTVRRIVATPASALAEVIAVDAIEGLLVRPERLT